MNILLVQPQFKKTEKSFPLGLGYIAATLKQAGHNVFGADLSFMSEIDIERLIKQRHIDLMGVSVISYNFDNVLSFINRIRSKFPIYIVLGGPHATIRQAELIHDVGFKIDFSVTGEGEIAMLELISALERKIDISTVAGLIWHKDKKVYVNSRRHPEDLDALPFPDRSIFPIFKYRGMIAKNSKYTQIVTSRGCQHKCSYCPEGKLWGNWRMRSAENVANEMQFLCEEYGIKEFHIEDSNFIGSDPGRVRNLCLEIERRKMKIDWQCTNGIPLFELNDLSLIDIMAKSGCYSIALGVESFDGVMTTSLGRRQDCALVPRIIERCKKNKMEVTCYLMIGFPGQKFRSILKDIVKSHKYNFDFVQYSALHIIPGSAMSAQPIKANRPSFLLMFVQKYAYFMLCFKWSVIVFTLRRLRSNNPVSILRRLYDYVFGRHLAY